MTNSTDDFSRRSASPNYGEGKESTVGVTVDGFVDPTGEYPRRDYFYGSSVNAAARGIQVNNLSLKGSALSVSMEVPLQKTSSFPFNDVRETPSGHVIEIDDTPGGERILIKHRLGGGIELRADGSFSSSAPGSRTTVTGGDDTVIIDGQCNIICNGDASLTVAGDYNVNVGGNYNLDVAGSEKVNVRQAARKTIGTNRSTVVRGSDDTRVAGDNSSLVLGSSVASIKGSYQILSEKLIEVCSIDTVITSEKTCIMSAMTTSISAGNMSVIGVNGTIGGASVNFFGNTFSGPTIFDMDPANGPCPNATFYGTFVGKATEAYTAEFAQNAEQAHSAHGATYSTTSGTANAQSPTPPVLFTPSSLSVQPAYQMLHPFEAAIPMATVPSYSNISAVLSMGSTSIRKVTIDGNGELLKQITKTEQYDEAFQHTPTTPEIRSMLRNLSGQQTDASNTLVSQLIAEGRLSTQYGALIPPATGRRASGRESSPRFGYNVIGNNPMENRSKRFKPK